MREKLGQSVTEVSIYSTYKMSHQILLTTEINHNSNFLKRHLSLGTLFSALHLITVYQEKYLRYIKFLHE